MSDRREGAVKAAAGTTGPTGGASGEAVMPPFLTDTQIRRLKVAVIVMGIVLLLGFAVVVLRIVQLSQRAATSPPAGPAAAIATPGGGTAEARRDIEARLPGGATVRSVSASGDRLLVHYESGAGGGVLIVDLGTGAIQRVTFGAAAP